MSVGQGWISSLQAVTIRNIKENITAWTRKEIHGFKNFLYLREPLSSHRLTFDMWFAKDNRFLNPKSSMNDSDGTSMSAHQKEEEKHRHGDENRSLSQPLCFFLY